MMGEMMTTLTLWHAPYSRSSRILWLLEEIQCSYKLETLPSPCTLDAALHPERPPALLDGQIKMHETGAMAEWLCETRALHLWRAPDSAGRAGWLDWLHFAETIVQHVARRAETGSSERLSIILDLLGEWLEGSEWLLSDFSGADCQIGYSVWLAAQITDLDNHPSLTAYLARCMARPACQIALGGGAEHLNTPSLEKRNQLR
jgi:glutathione S-transferase